MHRRLDEWTCDRCKATEVVVVKMTYDTSWPQASTPGDWKDTWLLPNAKSLVCPVCLRELRAAYAAGAK